MVTVIVSRELEDLIPGFLANRERDVRSLQAGLDANDFDGIRIIGHSMKGSGGGYGFDFISEIGARIETAAVAHDGLAIRKATDELQAYLQQVEVSYG